MLSSHILEEVERLSGIIQVIVAGRLAASGDFRAIRRLMTNRPHVFLVRTSDDRQLGSALMGSPAVSAVELTRTVCRCAPPTTAPSPGRSPGSAAISGIRLRELLPEDESLESVFTYLRGVLTWKASIEQEGRSWPAGSTQWWRRSRCGRP